MGLVSRWVRLGAARRPSSIPNRAFLVPAVDSSAVREFEQDGLVRARDLRERKEPPLAQKKTICCLRGNTFRRWSGKMLCTIWLRVSSILVR
jgi:hypothetical protein